MRPTRTSEHGARIAERREHLRLRLLPIVPSAGPFVWEIGSGHGHFLTAFAAAHPSMHCIGVDIASDRIARANRKRERARLGNLSFIQADAGEFLAEMPDGARFGAIFVLFPDPWPKRRHHKNRVMTPEFLAAAARAAGKGTPLYFRSDHEPYFREVAEMVRMHADWSGSETAPWPFEEATVFQKRAERHFSLVATRR